VWRYQAVSRTVDDETICSFIEVYFDGNGRLESWTEDAEIAPVGDSPADLIETLHKMETDAKNWGVVEYADLYVGLEFQAPKA
jgi:hypothetical protein